MQQQLTFEDVNDEYKAFVDKFKPKLTTDDCYTPDNIYEVIRGHVCRKHGISPDCIVRPFWPGGDYERFDYPEGCVVLDNPPFSILSKIVRFYVAHGIRFYLFAPAMTIFSSTHEHKGKVTCTLVGSNITYANGAVVNTAFCHNLYADGTVAETDPELGDIIRAVNDINEKAQKKQTTKLELPQAVITAAKINWMATHHTPYKLNAGDCVFTKGLDNYGKAIFGGAYLLSERAAAERAAAERAAAERAAAERAAAERAAARKVELSQREKEMQRILGA